MFRGSILAQNINVLASLVKSSLNVSNAAGSELISLQSRLASFSSVLGNKAGTQVGAKATSEAKKEPSIQLTEEMPPIPPNHGWPGDDNVEALYRLHDIRKSFKYVKL